MMEQLASDDIICTTIVKNSGDVGALVVHALQRLLAGARLRNEQVIHHTLTVLPSRDTLLTVHSRKLRYDATAS